MLNLIAGASFGAALLAFALRDNRFNGVAFGSAFVVLSATLATAAP